MKEVASTLLTLKFSFPKMTPPPSSRITWPKLTSASSLLSAFAMDWKPFLESAKSASPLSAPSDASLSGGKSSQGGMVPSNPSSPLPSQTALAQSNQGSVPALSREAHSRGVGVPPQVLDRAVPAVPDTAEDAILVQHGEIL
uniref:Uncharacterized protein n=1 Tax=Odontella aurita TaxID=265563 RepID=A0A7S4HJ62_9STRA